MRKFLNPVLSIAMLALLASVVTGREDPPEAKHITVPVATPATEKDDLDLDRLKRIRREGEVQDLFAGRLSSSPPPPVQAIPEKIAPPPPPPPPSAPPLPFKFLGRMADADRLVVFLERNQDTLSASVGDRLQNDYQVESIGETAVQFIYLPLGTRQVLNIPGATP